MRRILTILVVFHCSLFSSLASELVWYDGKTPITYHLPKKVAPVVKIALDMWKSDMLQVTGKMPMPSRKGTIQVVQGKGTDDGFRIYIQGDQIIVEGNNGRGMAYGLLELSRLAGVSPWVWWGDVIPQKKDRLVIDSDFSTKQEPSVAFRGIFLNDEDWSLRPWSCLNHDPAPDGTIGVQTYKKIFQLLLRLRANAVWPAMHEGTTAFFKIPGAKEMADSCGIVIGTSHCEPLLRNNVDEWDVKERGAFNYRTNREAVQRYWTERLQEVKNSKNNMFTIGMRGIHDSSMEGYVTEQEKFDGLQQVINDQMKLLQQQIGDPSKQMLVFVPYKEVLQLYEKGLEVPDHVTLMWCDDNYGYITRLSDTREQQRSGGGGVYYHLSYWGRPHDYLWLTTTQPGLIYSEMKAAYDHNCRKLWIANVHDPKVAAYDLEFFMDMAWNINSVTPQTINQHLSDWLQRQFGAEAGKALFPAMWDFYRLCSIRKPEFMGWTQVELDKRLVPGGKSLVGDVAMTSEETADRLMAFDRIKAIVESSRLLVRPELQDAYFAHVVYPVFASAAMTRKIVGDSIESHRAYEEIQQLTATYNAIVNGKWRGLMDAAPRQLPVFNDVRGLLATDTHDWNSVIARNAIDYDTASKGCQPIQMLGHSMNAVAIPKEGELVFSFETNADGDAMLYTAMIPTQPNDKGDLRYSVQLDDFAPVVISLKEKFRSEFWKLSVLRGQALKPTPVKLTQGKHVLKIKALDDHIICDQWMIDFIPDRKFYVIPSLTSPQSSGTTSDISAASPLPSSLVFSVQDIEDFVTNQIQLYPKLRLLDIYKSCFQDYMGAEHLVSDKQMAKAYLDEELATTELDDLLPWYYEPCGIDSNYYRISIRMIKEGIITEDFLLDAFIRSSESTGRHTVESWSNRWHQIIGTIDQMKLDLPNNQEDKQFIDSVLSVGKYAISHSPNYREAYHPHYRIVERSIFEKEFKHLITEKN